MTGSDASMTIQCILCDSWSMSPANPKSPRAHSLTERDVETALLLGFMWGSLAPKDLCDEHRAMVGELREKLSQHPAMQEIERRAIAEAAKGGRDG
jgi:hypothetical protein